MSKSSYIPKPGFKVSSDPPRALTDKEISSIVEGIGLSKAATAEVLKLRNQQIHGALVRLLKQVRLSPQALPKFRAELISQYQKTLAEPGLAVGIIPGEGIGKVTQTALKTRHTSGANVNVGSGIELLKEMIEAKKTRKNPMMSIYLNGYPSREEIISKGREMVELSISRLMDKGKGLSLMVRKEAEEEETWWHALYLELSEKKVPKSSTTFMRVSFSKIDLYNYRFSLNDIVQFIEGFGDGKEYVCIPSPFSLGFVDVFISKESLTSFSKSVEDMGLSPFDVERKMFQERLSHEFEVETIRGIKGVRGFNIKSVPLTDLFTATSFSKDGRNGYRINVLAFKARNSFVPVPHLLALFKRLGFTVPKVNPDRREPQFSFELEETKEVSVKENPNLISYIKGTFAVRDPEGFDRYGNCWTIIALGSNLLDVLTDPEVDRSRSYCNNAHDMLEYFGVEIGRSSFIRELNGIMKDGDLSSRHYEVVADNFFSMGRYFGSTLSGITKKGADPMTTASFQSATAVIRHNALTSRVSLAKSLSTAIASGEKIPFGSGMVTVRAPSASELSALESKHSDPAFVDKLRPRVYAVQNALRDELSASEFKESEGVELTLAGIDQAFVVPASSRKVYELPESLDFSLILSGEMKVSKNKG